MKIVILSRNAKLYSTKRLHEAAINRGHEAIVIDHLKCSVVAEVGNPKVYYDGNELANVDAIIPRIGASVTFFGASIVRQFEMAHTFTVNSSIAIVRSRDKLRSLQIFSKHGVNIPKTIFARHPKDIDKVIAQVGGAPVIIKLLEGTQGIGVVLAETRKAAKSVIEAFHGLNANILVQEFIKEAGGADLRVLVLDGKVIAAMKRQGADGEFRSNLHRGGSSTIVKLSRAEKKAAIDAAKAMGLQFAGVDLLQSERGPLILEVNSSPGLEGIENSTGIDIADKVIELIEKQSAVAKKIDKIGA